MTIDYFPDYIGSDEQLHQFLDELIPLEQKLAGIDALLEMLGGGEGGPVIKRADACGAGTPGGHGFAKDNDCAKGKGGSKKKTSSPIDWLTTKKKTATSKAGKQQHKRAKAISTYKKVVEKLAKSENNKTGNLKHLSDAYRTIQGLPNNPRVEVYLPLDYGTTKGHPLGEKEREALASMLREADMFALDGREGVHGDAAVEAIRVMADRGDVTHNLFGVYDPDTRSVYINLDTLMEFGNDAKVKATKSSPELNHTITHEIGHAMHDKLMRERNKMDLYEYRENSRFVGAGSSYRTKIAERVSEYATMEPIEFVAEVFAGIRYGKKYDKEVMDLYDHYEGPPLPKPLAKGKPK